MKHILILLIMFPSYLLADTTKLIKLNNGTKGNIVIVHGLGDNISDTWKTEAKGLYDLNYSIWGVEYPTSFFSISSDGYRTIKNISKDISVILKEKNMHNEETIIIGHSMGGLISIHTLLYYFPGEKVKLILLGTPIYGSKQVEDFNLITKLFTSNQVSNLKFNNNHLYDMARTLGHNSEIFPQTLSITSDQDKLVDSYHAYIGYDFAINLNVSTDHDGLKKIGTHKFINQFVKSFIRDGNKSEYLNYFKIDRNKIPATANINLSSFYPDKISCGRYYSLSDETVKSEYSGYLLTSDIDHVKYEYIAHLANNAMNILNRKRKKMESVKLPSSINIMEGSHTHRQLSEEAKRNISHEKDRLDAELKKEYKRLTENNKNASEAMKPILEQKTHEYQNLLNEEYNRLSKNNMKLMFDSLVEEYIDNYPNNTSYIGDYKILDYSSHNVWPQIESVKVNADFRNYFIGDSLTFYKRKYSDTHSTYVYELHRIYLKKKKDYNQESFNLKQTIREGGKRLSISKENKLTLSYSELQIYHPMSKNGFINTLKEMGYDTRVETVTLNPSKGTDKDYKLLVTNVYKVKDILSDYLVDMYEIKEKSRNKNDILISLGKTHTVEPLPKEIREHFFSNNNIDQCISETTGGYPLIEDNYIETPSFEKIYFLKKPVKLSSSALTLISLSKNNCSNKFIKKKDQESSDALKIDLLPGVSHKKIDRVDLGLTPIKTKCNVPIKQEDIIIDFNKKENSSTYEININI